MGFPFKSLREYLQHLDENNDLLHVKGEVDPRWEIGFIHKQLHMKQGPAVMYEKVKGFPGRRLVDHVLGTYDRCYAALNSTRDTVFNDYIKRTGKLVPPKVVEEAPFYEVVQKGAEVDLTKIPVPTWGEHDGGPYITCGALMARDPEIGFQNMAIYRIMVKGKNRTGVFIHMPKHVAYILAKYEQRGEPMPIAVAIGLDPLTLLCCEATIPYGVSEMDLWGALAGEPLECVRCQTNDLLVPATAEIVLEGFVLPDEREPEGPFGEFPGFYSGVYNSNVFHVERLLMRKDAIYQGMSVGRPPTEGTLIEGIMQCLESVKYLQESIPQVKAVRFLGTSSLQCVMALDKKVRYPGLARRAGNALWTSHCGRGFKNIFVVDDDIDIYNDNDIWWAMATRFQGDRDIVTIPNTLGILLDPSERRSLGTDVKEVWDSLTCRTIFDCTEPLPPFDEGYKRGVVDQPKEVKERVLSRWKELGLP